ncbi:hypothetical protein [Streptomyces mirabilis]|uniref:hypothetical protein n=1 Tax=Streptomyces mirabilis TaxID=68239 RepID=UPI0037FE21A4
MGETPQAERNVCPDCEAGPDPANACVGVGLPMETWHAPDCPQYVIMQINWEAGSRRIMDRDAWARGVFPAAHERLKQAVAAMPPDTATQPFINALTELVQAQADTTGFVVLHQWVEVLERHFPPVLPDPDHTTG